MGSRIKTYLGALALSLSLSTVAYADKTEQWALGLSLELGIDAGASRVIVAGYLGEAAKSELCSDIVGAGVNMPHPWPYVRTVGKRNGYGVEKAGSLMAVGERVFHNVKSEHGLDAACSDAFLLYNDVGVVDIVDYFRKR